MREFIEDALGEEGLRRSVVVCATSDQPSLVRLRAAFVATAIAEYFRDRGGNVMFMLDTVTRLARAQREIGLAIGEPPARQGYPPSVFSMLPRILERTGNSGQGRLHRDLHRASSPAATWRSRSPTRSAASSTATSSSTAPSASGTTGRRWTCSPRSPA